MDTRMALFGPCMKAAVEQIHSDLIGQVTASCPEFGKVVHRKRLDSKRVSTLNGEFSLDRPYFYCKSCQQGFHPLDEALGMASACHQYDIQEQSVHVAAELPFEMSAKLFADLTGIKLGDHFQHETLGAIGAVASLDLVIPDRKEIERRIDQIGLVHGEKPILAVTGDGAHMPTRPEAGRKTKRGPGRYQEAKGFRLYLVGDSGRIAQVGSWHQIQDAEAFRKDLKRVTERIPLERVRVALLGDGAEWLWSAMTECFPEGRPILDYYHCAEHIHTVAKAQFGEGKLETRQWAEAIISLLFYSEMDEVLGILRGTKPRTAGAEEEIRKLIGYLEKNQDRIHYLTDQEDGYPIGSGGIESAHKFICHTRLKRSGAWWVKKSGNEMLRIRCALVNGTYKRVFENYVSLGGRNAESGDK
ncbi:MAG: ISKra4 family transposase [Magnetococcus sp. DMHC-1]